MKDSKDLIRELQETIQSYRKELELEKKRSQEIIERCLAETSPLTQPPVIALPTDDHIRQLVCEVLADVAREVDYEEIGTNVAEKFYLTALRRKNDLLG